MATPTPEASPTQVVAALESALLCALDNLPDVAADPSFGNDRLADCCADIAALRQLLAAPYEQPNIVSYLGA